MILGLGVDIVEVARIERAVERWGEDFLNHVFCPEEIAYAKGRKFPAQHLAARFAAKEAVFKALAGQEHIGWKDIKILNDPQGRPICVFTKNAFRDQILISLSHTQTHAVANAVVTARSGGA